MRLASIHILMGAMQSIFNTPEHVVLLLSVYTYVRFAAMGESETQWSTLPTWHWRPSYGGALMC